jgi:hypothetical protein
MSKTKKNDQHTMSKDDYNHVLSNVETLKKNVKFLSYVLGHSSPVVIDMGENLETIEVFLGVRQ